MVATIESSADALIPISAATLLRCSNLGIDIYSRAISTDPPILFCGADQEITPEMYDTVSANGKLYIHRAQRDEYQTFLREHYEDFVEDESLPVIERVSVLSEVIRDVLSNQFANGTTETIVDTCQSFGRSSVALLGRESMVPHELCSVLHHDYGTFTHSANVSAYAVLLGRALGYTEFDLEQIAVGGLIHDLGKLDISDQILNKPAKLSDDEYTKVKRHPISGLQRIAHRRDLSFGQLMMVYQHHERLDGRGYPVGCHGDEIHPWGKLCAIVDVFEALTSNRPYRIPFSNATAFAVLERGSGLEFDKEMLRCWRRVIAI